MILACLAAANSLTSSAAFCFATDFIWTACCLASTLAASSATCFAAAFIWAFQRIFFASHLACADSAYCASARGISWARLAFALAAFSTAPPGFSLGSTAMFFVYGGRQLCFTSGFYFGRFSAAVRQHYMSAFSAACCSAVALAASRCSAANFLTDCCSARPLLPPLWFSTYAAQRHSSSAAAAFPRSSRILRLLRSCFSPLTASSISVLQVCILLKFSTTLLFFFSSLFILSRILTIFLLFLMNLRASCLEHLISDIVVICSLRVLVKNIIFDEQWPLLRFFLGHYTAVSAVFPHFLLNDAAWFGWSFVDLFAGLKFIDSCYVEF